MKTTTILQKVIEEIKTDPSIRNSDQDMVIMTELCNKIQEEENKKLETSVLQYLTENGPRGAAILLTLSIPYQRNPKEFSYLTLENDALTGWSVCYYVDFGKTGRNKLRKRHDIGATNPNHIMTKFAKIYKSYLGKIEDNQ